MHAYAVPLGHLVWFYFNNRCSTDLLYSIELFLCYFKKTICIINQVDSTQLYPLSIAPYLLATAYHSCTIHVVVHSTTAVVCNNSRYIRYSSTAVLNLVPYIVYLLNFSSHTRNRLMVQRRKASLRGPKKLRAINRASKFINWRDSVPTVYLYTSCHACVFSKTGNKVEK